MRESVWTERESTGWEGTSWKAQYRLGERVHTEGEYKLRGRVQTGRESTGGRATIHFILGYLDEIINLNSAQVRGLR